MGDFPDPDEEYELMYADELEMLRENSPGKNGILWVVNYMLRRLSVEIELHEPFLILKAFTKSACYQ